nr:hypothetical protein [uncultured Desulfobacter sp.]
MAKAAYDYVSTDVSNWYDNSFSSVIYEDTPDRKYLPVMTNNNDLPLLSAAIQNNLLAPAWNTAASSLNTLNHVQSGVPVSGWELLETAALMAPLSSTVTNSAKYIGSKIASWVGTKFQSFTGTGTASTSGETFYRTMSKADYDTFMKTRKVSATSETFTSPTKAFSEGYDGVLVEFNVKPGTTDALKSIGVRDGSKIARQQVGDLPTVSKGWNTNNAFFKGEGNQVNIGLGEGKALEIFNNNIQDYTVIRK